MTPRHTDQDVAALYCAIRATLEAEPRSLWARVLDLFAPGYAAQRRVERAAVAYATWQAARPVVVVDEGTLAVGPTVLARQMVRETMKHLRDNA